MLERVWINPAAQQLLTYLVSITEFRISGPWDSLTGLRLGRCVIDLIKRDRSISEKDTFSEKLVQLCVHPRCQHINPCSTPVSKDRARLFSVHSGPQSKRQRPQTEIKPSPLKCKENLFYSKTKSEIGCLDMKYPSLDLSKPQLDEILTSLL